MARRRTRSGIVMAWSADTRHAGVAVLSALGTWQIQRKAWKEELIAALTERLAQPPVAVAAAETWATSIRRRDEYRRVKFMATFDHGKEALVLRRRPRSGRTSLAAGSGICSGRLPAGAS